MLDASSGPKSGEGMWLWLAKILTGGLVLIILFIHFVVNHLVATGGLLTWADVVKYYTNPIIPIMEIAFLIFVVSHALIGLRSIVLDLKPTRSILKVIDWLFTLAGCVAVVYGIWLIFAIVAQGKGV
jgi:succinate dehydrogenase / fumarate reductase, membrane anchor subunit